MKTLRFEGHSDDTFGEMGIDGTDYDNCSSGEPIVFSVTAENEGQTDGVLVYGMYANEVMPKGSPRAWMVGIQNLEDDQQLPEWNFRIVQGEDCDYSPTLLMDVPDNYEIKLYE